MKNALQLRGALSKKFLAGTTGDYVQKPGTSSSKSQHHQGQLFIKTRSHLGTSDEAHRINRQTFRRLEELATLFLERLAMNEGGTQ
jgi:hypothetical protein